MTPIIELKDVWKIYKMGDVEVQALRGLTLTVRKGEFLALMGPSGSGKSTAVNMIGCLDIPTKGAIHLDGHDISKFSESDLAQVRGKKIGFIFQQFNLIPTLTARENVALPMVFQGVAREQRLRRAGELLDMVGLADRMDHRPGELSGGRQESVAIGSGLTNDPQVILADEPTGNLDSKTGASVMDFLIDLNRSSKKTVVMVTHDRALAGRAARVVYLMDGRAVNALPETKKVMRHEN